MTRPSDEMDLTQLCKPAMALHLDTAAAMMAWPHGIEFLTPSGTWSKKGAAHGTFVPGYCYRAKPAPNLIERQLASFTHPSDTLIALSVAHTLIATMSGGDPAIRKAYDEAIQVRRKSAVDANQAEIVAALRKAGATVQLLHTVGAGCPDLLVGFRGVNYLIEVKDCNASKSDRELRDSQVKWHGGWKGRVATVETVGAALAVIGAIPMPVVGTIT